MAQRASCTGGSVTGEFSLTATKLNATACSLASSTAPSEAPETPRGAAEEEAAAAPSAAPSRLVTFPSAPLEIESTSSRTDVSGRSPGVLDDARQPSKLPSLPSPSFFSAISSFSLFYRGSTEEVSETKYRKSFRHEDDAQNEWESEADEEASFFSTAPSLASIGEAASGLERGASGEGASPEIRRGSSAISDKV